MTIFVLTIFGGSVSADDRLEDEIVLYVEQELSVLEDVTVEKVLLLYNTSDEVIAYLCMLSPSGYAVYDPIYKNILEFSLEENQKFSEEKHYYIGVTQIYTKEQLDQMLSNIPDAQTAARSDSYTTEDFYFKKPDLKETESTSGNGSYPGVGESISHTPRLYNCNNRNNYSYLDIVADSKGVCGSLACAVVIAYIDDYVDDNYCDNNYKNSGSIEDNTYGIDLVKEIVSYLEPKKGDATLLWKLNDYLKSRGVSETIHLDALTGHLGMAKKQAARDEPYILGVAEFLDSPYDDHWMVGIGWITTMNESYVIVYDGLGNNGVQINLGTIATNWYIN